MQKVWLLYISIVSYIKEVFRHLVPFLFANEVLRTELELSYTTCVHRNALSTQTWTTVDRPHQLPQSLNCNLTALPYSFHWLSWPTLYHLGKGAARSSFAILVSVHQSGVTTRLNISSNTRWLERDHCSDGDLLDLKAVKTLKSIGRDLVG